MRPTRVKGAARECIGAGEVQDLELAVAHGLGEQPGVLIDDHGSKIELTGLDLGELLVHAVGRQTQVKIGERGNHLMHEAQVPLPLGPIPMRLPRRSVSAGAGRRSGQGTRATRPY